MSSPPPNPLQPNPLPQPCNPMVTKAKSGIFKPKTFMLTKQMCEIHAIPISVSATLTYSNWK